MRYLLVALALVGATAAAGAASPVAELDVVATQYHHNPTRLDELRDSITQVATGADAPVDALVALARVCFLWGDIRAATTEERLESYDRGRQAARAAVERAPRDAAAHFWLAVNTARWAQAKGLVQSLSLLPTVREEIRTVLELDPRFTAVYALAGNVDYEVPVILGGDLDRAETMFRKGLEQDPRFTGLRVGLGKTLIKKGRLPEARSELQAVLDERAPTNPADWTLKDVPEARARLAQLHDKRS
jgi:tetratricopeptide (TPR) repeat protein